MIEAAILSGTQVARVSASVEARDVSHQFDSRTALSHVDMSVAAGEIRALLGPNGAGKTTLIRSLMGLLTPTSGQIEVLGHDPSTRPIVLRRKVGFVPSGDRSLYLRLSGMENLRFFARLYGMRRPEALARSRAVIESVDLADAADRPVSGYSHGMQKRLGVARSLLTSPKVLLVDEATHDLDPEAADQVRLLVRQAAAEGAAVVWTTQRIDEIRGLADTVTLLRAGEVCFDGSVPDLMEHARLRGYLLRLGIGSGGASIVRMQEVLGSMGTIEPAGTTGPGAAPYFALRLKPDAVLGDAIAALVAAGVELQSCTEEQSALEEAFRSLTGREGG